MTTLSSAHLALLRHIAANEVKAMRRSDGVVQLWVDGVYVDHLGGIYDELADAGHVETVPKVAPKARPVTATEAGREWLAHIEGENAA